MITLKINNELKTIPTFDELTVKQFIELTKKEINIVNYLSVVLGIEYKDAFNTKVKGLDRLLKRLGKMQDYSNLKIENILVGNMLIEPSKIRIDTVGQRFMIEENARKLENAELLCFILSVAVVANPMDIEEINAFKEILLNEPYKKVLPIAFFLATRFLNGRRNAMSYSRMLKQLIVLKVREHKQAFSDFLHTLIILKFKRFANC